MAARIEFIRRYFLQATAFAFFSEIQVMKDP